MKYLGPMWFRKVELKIQEKLGEGQQGCVFKALRRDSQTRLSQNVAVKILHSKTAVDLWQKEFESLNRVRSPYCVQLLSFERVNGTPALLLEFVDGVSLLRLAEFNALRDDLIEEILAQVQQGLIDLQTAGLFHGDLSPRNILVDRNGTIRLLDFGLANKGTDLLRLTPDFAAPECFHGQGGNLAADLFSLGRIEQFLRRSDLSHCPFNNYLHFDPTIRTPRDLQSDPFRREKLGELVQVIQNHEQKQKHLKTLTLLRSERSKSRFLGIGLMVAGLFLSSSTARSRGLWQDLATLSVRTVFWHHFTVNGRHAGYAPLQILIPADQEVPLEWISPHGHGRRTIKLKRGQSLLLTDRDFSH